MRNITQEELDKIIENHRHWLKKDCDGWENMRANLDNTIMDGMNLNMASLDGASLDGASLNGASLNGASLNRASLDGAWLNGASLNRASLNRAWLDGASLNRASLNGASLNRAQLDGAWLNGASLNRASLDGAWLDGASLNRASLNGASLDGASIDMASLNGASLDGVKNFPFIPMACPESGGFIAWKKVRKNKIVKLQIPEDAKRSSSTGRKCRCDKAFVVGIEQIDGSNSDDNCVESIYDLKFVYRVGEMVSVDNFDENRFNECSTGIHFFINRLEAVKY